VPRRLTVAAAIVLCARCILGPAADNRVFVCASDADCADGWRCGAVSRICEEGGGATSGGSTAGGAAGGLATAGGGAGGATAGGATAGGGTSGGATAGGASGGATAGGATAGGATAGGATAGGATAGGATAGGATAGGATAGGATAGGATAGGATAGGSAPLDAGPLPGCIAAWDFDEDGGNTVLDRCRSHHGTAFNATRGPGVQGGSMRFLSANSRVRVPGSSDFDRGTGPFTITAWVRPTQALSHGLTLSVNYGTTDSMWGLELLSNTELVYWDSIEHRPVINVRYDGGWHHLAVTHTGTIASLYFDGTRLDGGTSDTTPRACMEVQLGNSTYNDPLGGDLDKVRFYGRALSDMEVVQDMNR